MEEIQDTIWLLTVKCSASAYPWVEGTLEETLPDRSYVGDSYSFQAKVYNEGSKFGINQGRISKLAVWKNDPEHKGFYRETIANYDRGWDIQPKDETAVEILQKIVLGLEESPKQHLNDADANS